MIDDRILELLDRKHAFVAKATDDRFMLEALPFVDWLFTEDLVRPYALQLMDEDSEYRNRFIDHRAKALDEATKLRGRIEQLYPEALKSEAGLQDPSPEYETSLTRFDRYRAHPKTEDVEEEDNEREPQRDQTMVGTLLRILRVREAELRGIDESEEKEKLRKAVESLCQLHAFRFNERSLRLLTSPGRSLRTLLAYCRALNPPPDGTDDWMPFLRRQGWKDGILKLLLEKDDARAKRMVRDSRADVERVYEELHAALGTSLSSIALIARFKERCTWFDKDGMRRLAAGEGDAKGVREDRLTMALARYLHDNGVFSLVRSRMANLEPDMIAPFGPRRMAIESKVHGKGESAKGAVRHGFWQLHAYLTSLETKTVRAHEGFLVVFRLGGGICDAPSVVALNRFRIHIMTIDLGDGESGYAQPKPSHIDQDELIEVAVLPQPPEESGADD